MCKFKKVTTRVTIGRVGFLFVAAVSAAACGAARDLPADATGPCAEANSTSLLPNGGFDSNVDGWRSSDPMTWVARDAAGCASSGALSFHDANVDSPCIEIVPGARYSAGMLFLGSSVECELDWGYDSKCNLARWQSPLFLDSSAEWKAVGITATAPDDAHSVTIRCENGAPGEALIDRAFFSPDGAKF
jgi:hypothetical protein